MASQPQGVQSDGSRHVHGWIHLGVSTSHGPSKKHNLISLHSLGDRHLENILLDTVSGDVVHVDFDCLFEKVSP